MCFCPTASASTGDHSNSWRAVAFLNAAKYRGHRRGPWTSHNRASPVEAQHQPLFRSYMYTSCEARIIQRYATTLRHPFAHCQTEPPSTSITHVKVQSNSISLWFHALTEMLNPCMRINILESFECKSGTFNSLMIRTIKSGDAPILPQHP